MTHRAKPAELGLGCVTFGREIDRAAAFAMMDHAMHSGITFFDTAAAYAGGASETIVGEWLRERGCRARVRIATKLLPPYTPDALRHGLELSLSRLKVGTVDQLLVHRWDASLENPASLQALDEMVKRGHARTIGASNFTHAQLERILRMQDDSGTARINALQNIHNFAVRGFDAEISRICSERGIECIGYSPLGAGFLTGKHATGVAAGSRFEIVPGHQAIYFNDLARQRLSHLQHVALHANCPVIRLAMSWALSRAEVSTVLVGGRTLGQLDQAIEARGVDLTATLAALDADVPTTAPKL